MFKKSSIFFVSFIFQCLFSYGNILEKKITLHADDKELSTILKILENKAGSKFAYKSSALNKSKKITVHFEHVPLEHILKIILFDEMVKYTVIGKQVVLFKDESMVSDPIEQPAVRDTIWTNVVNTVFVNDTNYVTVYDTVTTFDTIEVKTITKTKTKFSPKQKEDMVSLAYSFSAQSSRFDIPENDFIEQLSGYQLHNKIDFLFGKTSESWELASGLGFLSTTQNLKVQNTVYGSYYNINTDTKYIRWSDSSFISLPGMDTTWIVEHFTDTVKTIDSTLINTSDSKILTNKNSLYYLSIPIHIAYKRKLNRKTFFISQLQLSTHILLGEKYSQLEYDNEVNYLKNVSPEKVFVNGSVSFGVERKLKNHFAFCIMPALGFRISDMFSADSYRHKNSLQAGVNFQLKKFF